LSLVLSIGELVNKLSEQVASRLPEPFSGCIEWLLFELPYPPITHLSALVPGNKEEALRNADKAGSVDRDRSSSLVPSRNLELHVGKT
jgi:hypothetical protein